MLLGCQSVVKINGFSKFGRVSTGSVIKALRNVSNALVHSAFQLVATLFTSFLVRSVSGRAIAAYPFMNRL